MDWIRAHPYASGIAAACVLLIGGVFLIISRSTTPTSTGISAWNGNPGVATVPSAISATPNTEETAANAQSYGSQTLPYTPENASTTGAIGTDANGDSSFNYQAFLAELSGSSPSKNTVSASSTTGIDSNAWEYIPSGLISTSSGTQSTRTPTQQALYAYGNEVGSAIEGYDDTEGNQVQVMENALNDRQNTAKAQSVESIAATMKNTGNGIAEIGDVPTEALVDNTSLANDYTNGAQKLVAVAQALPGSDGDLVTAIEAYDTTMNAYVTDYVAIANLFKTYGVTFGSSDPGSVFTFSASGL